MADAMEIQRTTKQKGAEAEEVAAKFYQDRGWRVVARNFRHRMGELDLVLEGYGMLLFVEVKGREVFDPNLVDARYWRRKHRKLRRMASLFLAQYGGRHDYFGTAIEIVYVTRGRVNVVYEGETEPFF